MGCAASKPATHEPAAGNAVQAAAAGKPPPPQPPAVLPVQNGDAAPAEADQLPSAATTTAEAGAAPPEAAASSKAAPKRSAYANGGAASQPDASLASGGSPTAVRPPRAPVDTSQLARSRWPPDRGLEAGADTPFEMGRAASAPLPQDLGFRPAPEPADEAERNTAVCALGMLDTPPEPRFDDITTLLCQIFGVRMSIVSLIEGRRQWCKSTVGLAREVPRQVSFCAWTLLPQHPEMLVVPDALQDIRFADNPLVLGPPHIRFYAGAPLVSSSGHRLGSLCVIDTQPRALEADSCSVLINFAEVVVRELERDHMREVEAKRAESRRAGLLRTFEAFKEGTLVCASDTPDLKILYFNEEWARMTGMERSDLGCPVWDLFETGEKKEAMLTRAQHALEAQRAFCVDFGRRSPDGRALRFTAAFKPVNSAALDAQAPAIAVPTTADAAADGVRDDLYFCTLSERPPLGSGGSLASTGSPGSLHFRDEPPAQQHPFDDVKLGPLLGQGSFGRVFRGVWSGTQVAVKIIQPPPAPRGSPDASQASTPSAAASRAELECALTAQLSHPNIVRTLRSAQVPVQAELGSCAPAHETWLLLEYCDGGDLAHAIERGRFDAGFAAGGRRSGCPHLPAIRATALEVASAMAYLHGRGILHGDLTGGNILLVGDSSDARGFVAKVADFGLSRALDAEAVMTQTHGTVTHMPPELLTSGTLSKAADAYAWGIILWELFSGTRPWAGMLPMQVIYHVTILGRRIAFPEATPPAFRQLGEACLDPEPSRRPTFAQIVQRLQAL